MHIKFIQGILILLFANHAFSQSDLDFFLMKEQERIESLDGKKDGIINISSKDFNREATFVYFTLVDSLSKRIEASKADDYHKKSLFQALISTLREVNGRTYELTTYYQKLFTNAFHIISAIENKNLMNFLYSDPVYSIKNVYFIKHAKDAPEFLTNAGKLYPEEVFKVFPKFRERSYRDSIIVRTAVCAPNIAKKYLIGDNEIKQILWNSSRSNKRLKAIFDVFAKYGLSSNATNLIDMIASDSMTVEAADVITYDKRKYLKKLIELRTNPKAEATYSLDNELHIKSLEYVRLINDLHDEKSPLIRFKCVEGFSAKELYTLIIYSEEEIFTSTFNGLFERLIKQTKEEKKDGYRLLEELAFNKFRSFIKLCAGFNSLKTYLNSMEEENSTTLLTMFTGDLEKSKGDMTNAVDVADSFGSLNDTNLIAIIESNVEEEFNRVQYENNKQGKIVYGLLKSLFVKQNTQDSCWYETVSNEYQLEKIDNIDAKNLFDKDSVHRQLHFFYDDKDGELSFSSFINTFKNPNFTITDRPRVVIIRSINGKKIEILANKPKFEYDGQAELITYLDTSKKDIHLLVHRGHSYYAMNTVDHLTSTCKILFLGSCGGYHNLSEVLDRSPNVHIISSKQIGTMFVNNPLLKIVANNLREGKDINWIEIWNALEIAVKGDKYAYTKFQDYIPPHKNLGAIFIQAYRKMII